MQGCSRYSGSLVTLPELEPVVREPYELDRSSCNCFAPSSTTSADGTAMAGIVVATGAARRIARKVRKVVSTANVSGALQCYLALHLCPGPRDSAQNIG